MKFYTLIVFNFITLVSFGQTGDRFCEISATTKIIVQRIEKCQRVPSDTMGLRFAYLPKDYELTLLRTKVSVEELKELTNHKNAIVRCYAFKALTMVSEADAYEIVIKHLRDVELVETSYGCLLETDFVGDFFVNVYQGNEAKTADPLHVKTLDSLLIFTPNQLAARIWVIRKLKPDKKYYNRIREIAKQDRVSGALIALAKFQKEQDVDLILTTRVVDDYYCNYPLVANYQAIREFHHAAFIPFLETHLEAALLTSPTFDCLFLYEAIASYSNEDSKRLLSRLNQVKDSSHQSRHLDELSRAQQLNARIIEP